MNHRVRGIRTVRAALLAALLGGFDALAEDPAARSAPSGGFAEYHLSLNWRGLARPWLGRPYVHHRINWATDSLGILKHPLQNEWRTLISGRSNGVFIYRVQAGDTTGIPIAYDFDTYRLIKSEQNTLADWHAAVQTQLLLRDREKARDLVAISLPFKLPKAVQSIVGEGSAGLKVNGSKRISFSGRSQWRDGPQTSLSQSQSKFPSLDMEQVTQMTITGKIGTKIEVKVDQDSRRVTDLSNRIQLRYRGDEDEIIQTIEAGNTNLALPNTQFVGYSQRVQGLFGVKSTAQVGHVNLTAIVSQEKGSTEGATFTAGARGERIFKRDNDYLRFRYFWLFDPFQDTVWAHYFNSNSRIIEFRLFKTATFENRQTEPLALCLPTLPDTLNIAKVRQNWPTTYSTHQESANLQFVEETDYFVETRQFWLTLGDHTPVSEQTILACYMRIAVGGDTSNVVRIGELRSGPDAKTDSVSLLLLLLKSDNPLPDDPTWNLEWKNVYDLGARDINPDGFRLDVFRGRRGTEHREGENLNVQDAEPYIEILGLDRFSTNGATVPDGIVDDNPQILDRRRGHLIFLNNFPFAPNRYPTPRIGFRGDSVRNYLGDTVSYSPDSVRLAPQVPGIYSGRTATNRQEASEYYLAISTTERRTSYSLGRANIIEGSETVKLNGRPLTRGVDYTISYELGTINFLSEEVLDPNANVTVNYEYEPFFSVDRKTLFGMRGEYAPNPNFRWGATALFKSEKQPDNQKPRLGEEPSRTLIWDTDMAYKTEAPVLTKIADAMPFVEATAPSNIDVQAEVAQSRPNPNTKGEVFVDDFEASQEIVALPLLREAWTVSSTPEGGVATDRGWLNWYNRFDPYRATEIYDKQEQAAEDRKQVLTLLLRNSAGPAAWGGIMRSLSAGLQNMTNTQYVEFRIQGNRGRLLLSLGEISEDVDGDGRLDTEDKERNGFRNGILDDDEDTGLDGLFDRQEPDPLNPTYDSLANPDPSRDNWSYDQNRRNDYTRINGTEGNRRDPIRGWIPDTEDINGNNSLDIVNSYYEFEINLADPGDPYLVKNSEFCNNCSDGAALGPWRTFRIPLSDSLLNLGQRRVGSPNLQTVKYLRLLLTDVSLGTSAQVNIADMNLVSYRWRDVRLEVAVRDSQDLRVAVVNTRENQDYVSPPGVREVIDRVTLIGQGEQSLLLSYFNLHPPDTITVTDTTVSDSGDTNFTLRDRVRVNRAIVSQTLLASQDFTGYRRLDMFVHGDRNADGMLQFFLRFGSDSANFYEYQSTVRSGWHPANHIAVDFDQLTGFKFNVQKDRPPSEWRAVDTAAGGYRIRGNPSLSRIAYLEMGVANLATSMRSGEIWVDELRLSDVRRDVGWAARASVNANLSDLAGFGISYRTQNYAFQTLTEARSNVVNSSSLEDLSLNARFSPHKFLPASWGLQLPVSVTWGRSTNTPFFLTRSDIVVPAEARADESSQSTRRGISIAERFSKQTDHLVYKYLLIPLQLSLSYSESENTSPTVHSARSTSYNAQGRYQLSFQKPPGIPIFFWTKYLLLPSKLHRTRLTIWPASFNSSGTFTQRYSRTQHVAGAKATESFGRDFNGQIAVRYDPLPNLTTDYTYNTQRDLREDGSLNLTPLPGSFRLGTETSFNQALRSSYTNRLIPFLEQRYSFDATYFENLERQTDQTRSITWNRALQGSYGLSWQRLFGKQNDSDRWVTPYLYQPLRRLARGVFNRLDPLSFTYSRGESIRGFGYTERPWNGFVFGFSDEARAPQRAAVGISQRNSETTTDAYTARTGFSLLGARITATYSLRDQENDNSSSRTKTQSETFPSIRIMFTDLTKLGLIKQLANSATLEFGYDEKNDFQKNMLTGDVTSRTEDLRFSPLLGLSLNLRGNVSTNTKVEHTERLTEQPSTGTNAKTLNTEDAVHLSLSYRFTAPGGIRLPLLSALKLRSTMNLSTAISWSRSRTKQGVGEKEDLELRAERTTFSVAPQAGYSFSQTLTGGFQARWQDINDKVQQAKSHVRELGFWIEFRF